MSVVGHPTVTKRAYEQYDDLLAEAKRFAEATVFNGLGRNHELTDAQLSKLKAQIERDFLVALRAKGAAHD